MSAFRLEEPVPEERSLTDADIDALADALEHRLARRFYLNLGRGVWGLAWKAIVVILVGIAAAGYFKGGGGA